MALNLATNDHDLSAASPVKGRGALYVQKGQPHTVLNTNTRTGCAMQAHLTDIVHFLTGE